MADYRVGDLFRGVAPNHPNAVPSLVPGNRSLVVCGIFTGTPAIVMGHRKLRAIDASNRSYQGRGLAKAGLVCGWIIVGWTVLVVLVALGIAAGSGGG